uniref:CD209 antigen-like protein C n=1 Tax=Castor canadensis TaxID=51338 RepID=A0A8B7WJN0_CASCN|nr:CD209 antigen-like protein C [Castor canadensis]
MEEKRLESWVLESWTLEIGLLDSGVGKDHDTPSFQEQEQELKKIYQELTELNAGVDHLCHPWPCDWMFFQENCYFFSMYTKNWTDSVTACQEMGGQLVVIKSHEDQNFLNHTSKKEGYHWIGLSDQKIEGKWLFKKYWGKGQPNNYRSRDCVEFKEDGWNDVCCTVVKCWVCKKSAASCSTK